MYNVLIVDDEKIEREGIRFLLSREEGDFHILEASNGKQALNVLRSENIDLLLTDIKMPHMDGLELSKRAKEENEELQIVIFSGYNDFTFAQEAIRYGVKEYVLKPVDPDIFHETPETDRSEKSVPGLSGFRSVLCRGSRKYLSLAFARFLLRYPGFE